MNLLKLLRFQLLFFLIFGVGFQYGQIPPGYYDDVQGLTGEPLKAALNDIISGHIKFPYTGSGTNTWTILQHTDRDPNNSNNVILLYTGWSVNGPQTYNNGNGWNREHVWAKSRGNFGTSQGPGTDVHALRPCDISVNAARGNRWFGIGNQLYIDPDGPTECKTHTIDFVWEPRDEVKGDVARMIFYMATRYEGENNEVDLEVIDYYPGNNNTSDPVHAKLSVLLDWHLQDPVDDWERNRNNIIYTYYQKNRNPFIDHPEFVNAIWGSTTEIEENYIEESVELLKVVDVLGREVEIERGVLQLYIYSDGSVVKRIVQ